jgi:tRNA pseudouridine38-40 synthase
LILLPDIKREEKNWIDGINSNLPDAIAVTKMFEVPDDFHSRFSAVERSYTYVIYNSRSKPLFFDNCSHWDNNNLDIDVLINRQKCLLENMILHPLEVQAAAQKILLNQ